MEIQAHAAGNPARPPGPLTARLEGDIQKHIGRQLRAVYDEIANQPVPDRLLQLLEELDRKAATPPRKTDS